MKGPSEKAIVCEQLLWKEAEKTRWDGDYPGKFIMEVNLFVFSL